ncbi:NADP-dependent succinic semialdehyde dehydrogenase [Candidatus Marinamargulisbacteria bacterium SCGC AG-414-C22]|nr:NADP-dependent succinic semialdehyde dehydrogenase [Candidatus Marinamargulisbacteria bacterium SCGC AG-414-C22]
MCIVIGMTYTSINPYTEQQYAVFPFASDKGVDDTLTKLTQSAKLLQKMSLSDRLMIIKSLADNLTNNLSDLATSMSTEMGKTITESEGEIRKCVGLCDYYVQHADHLLKTVESDSQKVEPLGLIMAIMPWNFPLWQIFRVLIPQLVVGNVVLIKPALNVPSTTLLWQKMCLECSFFQCLLLSNEQVSAVISDDRCAGVSLTGSVNAGKVVASLAGAAIKPVVLELGGSDPFIVCSDADTDAAVTALVTSRFQNAGQSCIAAKRLLLHESIKTPFLNRLRGALEHIVLGDPLHTQTTMGPCARLDLQQQVLDQLQTGINQGAEQIGTVSYSIPDSGYFVSPQVLLLPDSTNRLWQEEVFGPLLPVLTFNTLEACITLANDSQFGLGASVWTTDQQVQQNIISQLKTGMVAVNKGMASVYDRPFGGIKQSGIGKELGLAGLLSFVNVKQFYL